MRLQSADAADPIRAATRPLRLALWGLGCAWLSTVAFIIPRLGPQEPPIQDVIRVQRLEIVEPDGKLAFVLANSQRPQAALMDGQVILAGQEEERRNPSFIFFDGKGDEVGGMLFSTGGPGYATRHLSLDGYKQDQTVVLSHTQNARGASSGLHVSDRPTNRTVLQAFAELGLQPGFTRQQMQAAIAALPEEGRDAKLRELFGMQRVFVGSDYSNVALLRLNDGEGRPRILIGVPATGAPYIRVLDEAGAVVLQLPETGR